MYKIFHLISFRFCYVQVYLHVQLCNKFPLNGAISLKLRHAEYLRKIYSISYAFLIIVERGSMIQTLFLNLNIQNCSLRIKLPMVSSLAR